MWEIFLMKLNKKRELNKFKTLRIQLNEIKIRSNQTFFFMGNKHTHIKEKNEF